MVFSSFEFLLLYFPLTLLLYYAVPRKYLKARNLVLFITSLAFYGWGEPKYVFLMLFTIAIDYAAGFLIEKYIRSGRKSSAKRVLIATVIINLALLGFFKYCNFIIENIRLIPIFSSLKPTDIPLPIGISFYTFQAMSYAIDVYREECRAQSNFVSFGSYVTMFPQLIAGPIVRYRDVALMLEDRSVSVDYFASGVRRFTVGLTKKLILADGAGAVWKYFLGVADSQRGAVGAWLGLIMFTFQIYFDFSGYSDMAIGLGRMLGFEFLENFNYPYISRSITEFWRRWHISLSTWFREYVYIPLGGNRRGELATYRNLLAVWLLTGLWHGASWSFVLWGLYYFILLTVEKKFSSAFDKIPTVIRQVLTLLAVMFGWLIFEADNTSSVLGYLSSMLGGGAGFAFGSDIYDLIRLIPFTLILAIGATPLPKRIYDKLGERCSVAQGIISTVLCAVGLIASIAYAASSTYSPFLYFKF